MRLGTAYCEPSLESRPRFTALAPVIGSEPGEPFLTKLLDAAA
jgi:hypothetical protein